jgi:hypothetical protein
MKFFKEVNEINEAGREFAESLRVNEAGREFAESLRAINDRLANESNANDIARLSNITGLSKEKAKILIDKGVSPNGSAPWLVKR